MGEKPRIFILGTGGTIAAATVKGRFRSGELTQEEILSTIPGIGRRAEIVSSNIFRVRSSNCCYNLLFHWHWLGGGYFERNQKSTV